jgi:hypothetical protein
MVPSLYEAQIILSEQVENLVKGCVFTTYFHCLKNYIFLTLMQSEGNINRDCCTHTHSGNLSYNIQNLYFSQLIRLKLNSCSRLLQTVC